MSEYYYKHLSNWERRKIESLISNKPILKPISGQTNHGWVVVDWKWLIDINSLAFQLKRSRKTIKRELLNGRYKTLTNNLVTLHQLAHIQLIFLNLIESEDINQKQKNKILKYEKLKKFIVNELNNKQKSKSNSWEKQNSLFRRRNRTAHISYDNILIYW